MLLFNKYARNRFMQFSVSHHEFSAINETFKSTFASYFRNIKKFALKYLPLYRFVIIVVDARLTTNASTLFTTKRSVLSRMFVCRREMSCQFFLKQKPEQHQKKYTYKFPSSKHSHTSSYQFYSVFVCCCVCFHFFVCFIIVIAFLWFLPATFILHHKKNTYMFWSLA